MINGDNKETLAVLHGMGILKDNGLYCGVLKEGVFFDGKFKDLRKNLVENYNVQYVISIPQSDFWNTSTKTSILIFKNDKQRTKEINFCELKELIEDGDNIGVQEINPETKKIIREFISSNYEWNKKDGEFLTVSYENIVSKDYTFNFKNFIKQDIKVGKGFKVVKLGDICECPSYEISDENTDGIYNFYTCSNKIKKCSNPNINGNYLLLGSRGTIEEAIHLTSGLFGCGNNLIIIKTKDNNNSLLTYIYYYLTNNKNIIQDKTTGSTVPMISKKEFLEIEIPIPENIETIKLYLDYLQPANQTLQTLQTQKEASICGKIKLLTSMGNEGVDYDEYNIMKLINMKDGKYNSSDMIDNGKYHFYNASVNNPVGTINEYCFEGDKYILFVKSGGNSKNKISDSHALGLPILVKGKCSSNVHVSKITIINNIISYDYLFYYLLMSKPKIQENAKYSTGLGGVDMEYFRNLSIRILKPDIISKYKLDEDFEFMDKLKNDIQNTLKIQEETTKQMMSLVLNHTSSDEKVELNEELSEKSGESSESDEDEYETIEYKGKNFILEGDKVYNINEYDTKGKLFGNYIDGKVKKIKTSDILVV